MKFQPKDVVMCVDSAGVPLDEAEVYEVVEMAPDRPDRVWVNHPNEPTLWAWWLRSERFCKVGSVR